MSANPRNALRSLFLDREGMLALAALLHERPCPDEINPEEFRQLRCAELPILSLDTLRLLCDAFGAELILGTVRWPRVRGER